MCDRCLGAESSLEDAMFEVARVLELTGVEVVLRKVHVDSEARAQELGFVSSPTIRINGMDIQPEIVESPCETCGDLCGCGADVSCRVWLFEGKEHTTPPVAMIIEAILRESFGNGQSVPRQPFQAGAVPGNLARFFAVTRSEGTAETNVQERPARSSQS